MPITLYRIDDRLIHGQVVIGWGQPLGVRLVVLVDDEVHAAEWEQDLYRAAMPKGMAVRFVDTEEACRELPTWQGASEKTVVLTGDIASMVTLARCHPSLVQKVNLGGIHHRQGRTKRLPYVYLSEEEFHQLESLQGNGVRVVAQDVPSAASSELEALG
jgi:PTS system mannose-specific IIB component/fructoselysine and glucoselysine-specific PTS system IIB component